jgi:hypothetical protein
VPLFIDEAPEAFCHHQGSGSELDDLNISAGDEEVKRAAAYSSEPTGIIDAHADRFDTGVPGSNVDCFNGSCGHRLRSKPIG